MLAFLSNGLVDVLMVVPSLKPELRIGEVEGEGEAEELEMANGISGSYSSYEKKGCERQRKGAAAVAVAAAQGANKRNPTRCSATNPRGFSSTCFLSSSSGRMKQWQRRYP